MLRDLILENRSCRRFYQESVVELGTLKELVDLARMSASGRNLQPLKYILSCSPEKNVLIFPNIALGRGSQPEGDRPSAYIVILGDTAISKAFGCNHGIAAQSIMLGAAEKGLAGCIIASIRRDQLRQALAIPSHYEILLVLALGKPKETSVIDSPGPNGDIAPWRDDKDVRHVPKRRLDDIIVS